MKILILIEDISLGGGTERVALTLAKNLNIDGIACDIFSLSKSNEDTFYSSDNLNIYYAKSKNSILAKIEAINHAKKNKMKLLIFSMGRLSVEIAILSRLCLFKHFCCYEHISFTSFSGLIQKIKLFSYRLSRGVVFLTEHDRDLIQHKLPFVPVASIENISPFSTIKKNNTSTRKNIVLAVGRLTKQKNFSRLIDLWSRVDRPEWSLIIAGNGPDRYSLDEQIKRLGLSNVKIVGAVREISKLYLTSKILVLTSRYEGFPMVMVEAQCFGLPAVSFDCKTGPSEIIINESTGYIIPYHDDALFIEKLQRLIDYPEELDVFSCNSLKNAQRFTYENTRCKWLKVLEKI
ncbi:glycosyltransferase [Escherichia albertii]|uniref:Predicted glycosyltransferase, group I family n=1 Tax=Escherichia albertii TaxID=208962 RepID=A0A5A4U3Z4_ESCAL|nr:glycosyltransferase [Escherichia albertii]MCZ8630995.1 glycosyltransferase [Escherichia albertii]MCZ8635835.1 glycosyltransferase [Escherichia albertii]MCZ8672881.1 glycosyltransferase [Escherichia albertii]BBM62615.1 predicted glycosyltransferase, group I family [Escherichia albertii]